jgi:uncharacterized membrane protein
MKSDQGSIIPLIAGLAGLLLLLLSVVVDLSHLFLTKRSLMQVADSAAIAASTALDESRYYAHGVAAAVPLDTQIARANAMTVVGRANLKSLRIHDLEIRDGVVYVELAMRTKLPWGPFGPDEVSLVARAGAAARRE